MRVDVTARYDMIRLVTNKKRPKGRKDGHHLFRLIRHGGVASDQSTFPAAPLSVFLFHNVCPYALFLPLPSSLFTYPFP
jgi:hypothetical protein